MFFHETLDIHLNFQSTATCNNLGGGVEVVVIIIITVAFRIRRVARNLSEFNEPYIDL